MSPSATSTIEKTQRLNNYDSLYFDHSKSAYLELNNGVNIPKHLIGNALKEKVESVDQDICEAGEEDTFFVADLGEVYRQHMRWKRQLPRVKPFYGKIMPPPYAWQNFNMYSGEVQPGLQSPTSFGGAWNGVWLCL